MPLRNMVYTHSSQLSRTDSKVKNEPSNGCRLSSENVPGLKKWLEKHQYMSHQMVNEMITLMGNTVLRKLLLKIREACLFAILSDETCDISNHEQLCGAIRWAGCTYDVHEDFLGLVHVPSTTSVTLTAAIKDVLAYSACYINMILFTLLLLLLLLFLLDHACKIIILDVRTDLVDTVYDSVMYIVYSGVVLDKHCFGSVA